MNPTGHTQEKFNKQLLNESNIYQIPDIQADLLYMLSSISTTFQVGGH